MSTGTLPRLLVADDEGHGFRNKENLFAMFWAIDRHFATDLGGRTGV